MSIVRLAPLVALILPAAAAAQSMNAETFHRKAVALQKKGPMALLSGDLKLVMNEGKAAAAEARAQRQAAIRAGKAPRYCPPEGVKGMGSDEYLAGLAAIPEADRARIDMTEATIRILARKYPCRS